MFNITNADLKRQKLITESLKFALRISHIVNEEKDRLIRAQEEELIELRKITTG